MGYDTDEGAAPSTPPAVCDRVRDLAERRRRMPGGLDRTLDGADGCMEPVSFRTVAKGTGDRGLVTEAFSGSFGAVGAVGRRAEKSRFMQRPCGVATLRPCRSPLPLRPLLPFCFSAAPAWLLAPLPACQVKACSKPGAGPPARRLHRRQKRFAPMLERPETLNFPYGRKVGALRRTGGCLPPAAAAFRGLLASRDACL